MKKHHRWITPTLLTLGTAISTAALAQAVDRSPPQAPVLQAPAGPTQQPAPVEAPPQAPSILPTGVPLRIEVTRTANLKTGTPVQGRITTDVFLGDRLVIPANSLVTGTITATPAQSRGKRTWAILDGDVTPLRDPVLSFNQLTTVNGASFAINTLAQQHTIQLVRVNPKAGKHQSLKDRLVGLAKDRAASAKEQATGPRKRDRFMQFLYGQLPYHPQRVWAGSLFDAGLQDPLDLHLAPQPLTPLAPPTAAVDNLIVRARLTQTLSSDTAHNGDPITAIVTEPLFDDQHRLLAPEGTTLTGRVLQAKPARSFGRNGQLRFVFQSVTLPYNPTPANSRSATTGIVNGVAGDKGANLTVDSEGGIQSNPDKGRFAAPILLGALTVAAQHQDRDGNGLGRQTVASNGFGIVARVITLSTNNANIATGFGAYSTAKSIYKRFLTRGHPVDFPTGTQLEVRLTTR